MPTPQTGQTGIVAWSQLIGLVGQAVPQPVAKQLVAQAWRFICAQRVWSFLRADGYLVAPAAISGAVTFTRGDVTATADATLQALIEAPAESFLVGITKRAVQDENGFTYQIRDYETGGTITLNRPYLGSSGSQSITIFRQYYTPPISEVSDRGPNVESSDFRSWRSLCNGDSPNRYIDFRRTSEWLDQVDPRRTRTGEPYYIVEAPYDVLGYQIAPTGTPMFEMWPYYQGDVDRIYICKYIRHWIPLSDDPRDITNVLPLAIPISYLIAQAKLTAYEWAEANKGNYPKLQKTNWFGLIQQATLQVGEEFLSAQRTDEERYPEDVDNSYGQYNRGVYGQNVFPYPGGSYYSGYGIY